MSISYLNSMIQSVFNSKPNDRSVDSPLIDLYHNDSSNMNTQSMQLTCDVIAASVRASLRQFTPMNPTKRDCRVLVLGSYASIRAKYISNSKDFPTEVYQFNPDKQQSHGGIFYVNNELSLGESCSVAPFDAILSFNQSVNQLCEEQAMQIISRLLRPSGAFAGTGLFHSMMPYDDAEDYISLQNDECISQSNSLKGFRDHVESYGFFMHTCGDVSLEGSLAGHVLEDERAMSMDELDMYEAGKLLAGRFLATKASMRKARPDLSIQTDLALTKKRQVDEMYALSMQLNDSLATLSATYETATPSSSCSNVHVNRDAIVVTGVSLGLPNGNDPTRKVFDDENFNALFRGENFITQLTAEDKQRIIGQNVFQVYKKDGKRIKVRLSEDKEIIQVAAKIEDFDLRRDFPGVPAHVCEVLDATFALAIGAGLKAVQDAGFDVMRVDPVTGVHSIVGLPECQRDDTGVIFASSFPALDAMVAEASLSVAAKTAGTPEAYEYDRKLLFKLLVMANGQLAELIKARGPNTQINAACAGTTQAISVAEDWIRLGRCKRVIVISADHATSNHLFPYLGTGFLALGAASTLPTVAEAAAPFDARRKGMILGAGAVGLVVETSSAAMSREANVKAEILGSCISNSAFHASLMDAKTTSNALNRFITQMEAQHGIDRHEIANDMIYFSHETCTHANGGCAKVELDALQHVFGDDKQYIMMANTKGFTGHPMGVGIEDVIAVKALAENICPPIANFRCADPLLCLNDNQIPRSTTQHNRRYVLRFAAGFGSQFAYILYRQWDATCDETASPFHSRGDTDSPFTPLSTSQSDISLIRSQPLTHSITGNIPLA